MQDGFIRIATGSPQLVVANTIDNTEQIIKMIKTAAENNAQLLVMPEMALTGYTAGDLFLQDVLLNGALEGLKEICRISQQLDMLIVLGAPIADGNCLYNCGVVIKGGKILGIVPKTHIPNYGEFYELRHFAPAFPECRTLQILGESVPFGTNLIFACEDMPQFKVALEICEDLWAPNPPGIRHALAGATVLCNPSASDEVVGKAEYRRLLVSSHSARLVSTYVYADAGPGESTQDMVFAAHNLICENGRIAAESEKYTDDLSYADVDLQFLSAERRRMNTFREQTVAHITVPFRMEMKPLELKLPVDPMPFVPQDPSKRAARCEEILSIQAHGLAKRLVHAHAKTVVIGVSGGLDSTLALLVADRALKIANMAQDKLIAITMPCFGTTGRTYNNALKLANTLSAQLMEINIEKAVLQHFKDIGHSESIRDVVYENSQARERTQVLMDVANKTGGMVIGTGDLSELALGWATYNGDHMSMYAVNSSVPKTLIRYLVAYVADKADNEVLREVLYDVLDTPVSPELLPPTDGKISQKTEDLVGPYELHDFFLYHFLRRGAAPEKILRLAKIAFDGKYDAAIIAKWLQTFIWRFFSQQFKRSCIPDGPKVGTVTLSPRGDLRMPSDASSQLWKL